ncbi:YjbE family integral membrane protein [Paenibacillus turicensis]|uniref:YjbE family integral membrane protein n=1 Tax=Paenibacillus turicensis TaxID=160487 RepID=A0ABS4FPP3_9BACL|nr:TerC family protein [Paenibacillus turicensis]MBP1904349.1 YjbE family integral membrane protein [Paenibacillus turicensis]
MEHIMLLIEILIINLVLSGDNAVVIAMASNHLPKKQQKYVVWLGSLGAVILRCLLCFLAVILLKIPFIQAAGGIMLAIIAFKLLLPNQDHSRIQDSNSMWRSVWVILAADFVMSLDNVLAIAAIADGDIAVLMIGIAISIPIVVWGSTVISEWLARLPILSYAGAGILGITAGKMLLHDERFGQYLYSIIPSFASMLPWLIALVVIACGWLNQRQH